MTSSTYDVNHFRWIVSYATSSAFPFYDIGITKKQEGTWY